MENDYQPKELVDEIVKHVSNSNYIYSKDIKLLSNEKMKCHNMSYSIMSLIKKKT